MVNRPRVESSVAEMLTVNGMALKRFVNIGEVNPRRELGAQILQIIVATP